MTHAEPAWSAVVPSQKTGYIQGIDEDSLLDVARARGTSVRMDCGIGEFVVEGTPLISVADPGGLDEDTADELNAVYVSAAIARWNRMPALAFGNSWTSP